jgi:cell division septation protein DedD
VKRTRSRDSSSIFFISKWVVIIALVIVISISFTLGYYVGQENSPDEVNQKTSIIPKDKDIFLSDKEPGDITPVDQERSEKEDGRSQTAQEPAQESQASAGAKQTVEAKPIQNPHETQKPSIHRKSTAKITYTVQAGAFTSPHDAGILKEKLVKKGYTAYIIQSESKKHERLYKVMIGEFTTRKQAEVLSLRIKKSEGLQTFVTFRTKEDVLR